MNNPRCNSLYSIRDFHILSDAFGGCKNIDAICQFKFKGFQISISTAGLSKGACHTPVAVFKENANYEIVGEFSTVEQAIDFINNL